MCAFRGVCMNVCECASAHACVASSCVPCWLARYPCAFFMPGSHRCAEGIRTELTHTTYRVSHSPAEPQKWGPSARAKSLPASRSQSEPLSIRPHPLLCPLLGRKCHFLRWAGRVTASKTVDVLPSQTREGRGQADALSRPPCSEAP